MTQADRNLTIKRLIERYTTKNTTSPKVAREALIREGIYTKDGKLMPRYGGPAAKKR